MIGGEFQHSGGIGFCSEVRSWCASSYNVFTNPNYLADGTPHYIIGPDSRTKQQPQNGLILAGVGGALPASLVNQQFNAAGTGLIPYMPGQLRRPGPVHSATGRRWSVKLCQHDAPAADRAI